MIAGKFRGQKDGRTIRVLVHVFDDGPFVGSVTINGHFVPQEQRTPTTLAVIDQCVAATGAFDGANVVTGEIDLTNWQPHN